MDFQALVEYQLTEVEGKGEKAEDKIKGILLPVALEKEIQVCTNTESSTLGIYLFI